MIEVRDKLSNELIESHPLPVGESLLSWITANIDGFDYRPSPPISINLNGRILLQARWSVILRETDTVVIYPEPKAAVGALILKAIVTAAVSYAVSALTAPKVSDNYSSTVAEGTIYSPNVQGNTARLNGVVPQIFGIHKYYPDTISAPWRYYENDEQYLMLLLGCGVGRYQFNEINIGNTSVDDYADDIEYQIFEPGEDVTGHPAYRNIYTSAEVGSTTAGGMELVTDDYGLTGVKAPSSLRYNMSSPNWILAQRRDGFNWFDESLPFGINDLIRISDSDQINGVYKIIAVNGDSIRLRNADGTAASFTAHTDQFTMKGVTEDGSTDWIGPFTACPSTAATDLLMLDFYHPGGLAIANNDGSLSIKSIDVEINWREYGSTVWNVETFNRTDKTLEDIAYTHEIPLASRIRPEIRVKRTSEASEDSNVRDTIQWMALRSELPAASRYPDMTVMAVKIRGTNALSASAENKFNTVQYRKLPVYNNGTWSPEVLTSAIAPVFSYIIKNCGHPDSRIALDTLDELHQIWQARGDKFNAVFDNDSTLFAALERVLAIGYAVPTISAGKIDIVREVAHSAWGQTFSADNTLSITENGTLFDPDEPDGVRCEYFDSDTWQSETVDCLLPGDSGITPEEVRAFGVTNKTAAWRYGMRIRRARKYIRRTFDVETELEGLNADLGEKCSLPSRHCQHGWLTDYDAVSLQVTVNTVLSDTMSGAQHYLCIRRPDGTLFGPVQCSLLGGQAVLIASPLDFMPAFNSPIDKPLFKFGTWDDLHIAAIAKVIEPQGDTVNIQLSVYDERLFADDDNTPPE